MSKPDVIMAVMKLTRAMKRGPMHHGHGPAPHMGGGRLMSILKENSNVTSRELAELLDIRPSSLTEILTRLEKDGLLTRTADENDRRVSRVSLTEKGEELENQMSAEREKRLEAFSACFTDDEAAVFCEMCDRLRTHLETLDSDGGERPCRHDAPPHFHHGCPPPHHFHGPCGGGARPNHHRHCHHGRDGHSDPCED